MPGRAERKLHSSPGEMPGQGEEAASRLSDFVPPPAASTVLGHSLHTQKLTNTCLAWGYFRSFFYFIHFHSLIHSIDNYLSSA